MGTTLKTIKNINFDWMMKLKTNRILIKKPRGKKLEITNKD